jgi:asparagine synthase (glutamine-hydrolysing)
MCGIAGAVSFSGRPIEEGTVVAMCDAIRHRGPDEGGVLAVGPGGIAGGVSVGLGNRRLSIIDVAGGH